MNKTSNIKKNGNLNIGNKLERYGQPFVTALGSHLHVKALLQLVTFS